VGWWYLGGRRAQCTVEGGEHEGLFHHRIMDCKLSVMIVGGNYIRLSDDCVKIGKFRIKVIERRFVADDC
jgi:hypothetical protein